MVDVKLRHLFSWQSVPGESVLGLKWTNDVNIKFISSKLNTSGNLHQEPLIPLSLLPEVNHMPVLGWKVVIHYL